MAQELQELAKRVHDRLDCIRDIASHSNKLKKRELEGLLNDQESLISSILISGLASSESPDNKTQLLIRALSAIAEGHSINEILQGALTGATILTGASAGAILFKEELESHDQPSIKYYPECPDSFIYSKTVVKKVMDTGKGIYEKDITKSDSLSLVDSIVKGGILSVMAVPIKSFGETIGVIYLDNRVPGTSLNEDDLPFLCDFASLASLMYENMSLATRRIQYLEKDTRYTYKVIVGKSKALQHVDDLINRYAPIKQPVLITGETGTGKRLVADELHHRSNVPGPFIIVNCAGIPESLFESEFFGHVKGAFTDAVRDKKGLIDLAQNGTLFLDEIGELTLGTQAKLLQFLDDNTYRMVGDSQTRHSNARVITATNRDLPDLLKNKSFREDLYYRLNVLTINLPPLSSRLDDIPELCEHFIELECRNNLNKPVMKIHRDVVNRLMMMPWKGNVRELRNIIQRLIIHTDNMTITSDTLDKILQPCIEESDPFVALLRYTEDEITSELRKRALELEGGNVAAASRRLGIAPQTLHKWIKKTEFQIQN